MKFMFLMSEYKVAICFLYDFSVLGLTWCSVWYQLMLGNYCALLTLRQCPCLTSSPRPGLLLSCIS